ncbi:maltoporin [Pectobacterium brasiliense]|uniref:maltoporin n=1 Tax=Pectobacterium brasiliense TaxID=180957 RepID=UPI0015DEE418|nr:maltoporin [Pectobacterium brasiliense]MBA0216889.1 maltoporin [Pectobacterium brasiliense]
MKRKLLTTSIALSLAMLAPPSYSVDFSGYFRSGVGVSTDGKQQTANKNLVGRLGNEDDTYGEIQLGQQLYNENGKTFYFDSMISLLSDGSNDNETTKNDDAEFGLRQLNLQAKGFVPNMPDAVVWAGKRYYQRRDIHIIDTKYYNISGSGAGIENIKAGEGAFSFAWIRGDGESMATNKWNEIEVGRDPWNNKITTWKNQVEDLNINYLDARYAGWKPWNGAWTEFGLTYAMPNPTDAQKEILSAENKLYDAKNGVMATAELSHYFSNWKANQKLVLQYADKGLAQNMISQGGGWYDVWHYNTDATGYRAIQTGDIPLTEQILISHVLTYGKAEKISINNKDKDLISAVARGQYSWTKNQKTYLEIGTFRSTETELDGNKNKSSGQKYTIAHAFSADIPMLARPELRFYVSYLNDGENKSFNSNRKDNTMNFGIQAEAWW